jgi:hypothetical protein
MAKFPAKTGLRLRSLQLGEADRLVAGFGSGALRQQPSGQQLDDLAQQQIAVRAP